MKLTKYIVFALVLLFAGEAFAQTVILSGKVTEVLGNKLEPIYSANVVVVNRQDRYLNGVGNYEYAYQ